MITILGGVDVKPGAVVPMSKSVKQMAQPPYPEPIKLTRKGVIPKVVSRNVK